MGDPLYNLFGTGSAKWAGYQRISEYYRADANPLSNTDLLTAACNHFETPAAGALARLVQEDTEIVVHLLFGVRRYGPIAERRSDLTNRCFAYHGNVGAAGGAPLLKVVEGTFDTVLKLNVYKHDELYRTFLNNPQLMVVPPPADSVAQTEAIQARQTAFVTSWSLS